MKKIKDLPTSKEVGALTEKLNGSIKSFTKDNKVFTAGFESQNIMLRRYDEVLTGKLNKHSLH